ncbi:interleukin-20 [Rhynchocyon petersi]
MATLPSLSLFLILWSQMPEVQCCEFRFGPCRVQGIELQELRKAVWTLKDIVQTQDKNSDIQILRRSESLQNTKQSDQCCFLRHLLRLYLNSVFRSYKPSDHHTLREISSLTNSFLIIKKDLRLCHDNRSCYCGEEALEKYSRILSHFQELEPQAAVVKAFGELDILLQWIEDTKQEETHIAG